MLSYPFLSVILLTSCHLSASPKRQVSGGGPETVSGSPHGCVKPWAPAYSMDVFTEPIHLNLTSMDLLTSFKLDSFNCH